MSYCPWILLSLHLIQISLQFQGLTQVTVQKTMTTYQGLTLQSIFKDYVQMIDRQIYLTSLIKVQFIMEALAPKIISSNSYNFSARGSIMRGVEDLLSYRNVIEINSVSDLLGILNIRLDDNQQFSIADTIYKVNAQDGALPLQFKDQSGRVNKSDSDFTRSNQAQTEQSDSSLSEVADNDQPDTVGVSAQGDLKISQLPLIVAPPQPVESDQSAQQTQQPKEQLDLGVFDKLDMDGMDILDIDDDDYNLSQYKVRTVGPEMKEDPNQQSNPQFDKKPSNGQGGIISLNQDGLNIQGFPSGSTTGTQNANQETMRQRTDEPIIKVFNIDDSINSQDKQLVQLMPLQRMKSDIPDLKSHTMFSKKDWDNKTQNNELQTIIASKEQEISELKQLLRHVYSSKEGDDLPRELSSKQIRRMIMKKSVSEVKIHFAMLFSSPLIIKSENIFTGEVNFSDIPQIDWSNEFTQVTKCLEQSQKQLKFSQQVAMVDTLNQILSEEPLGLHFSGHGIESNERNFGQEGAALRKNEGNMLVFEDGKGCQDFITEKMLKDIVRVCDTRLEFVYVASCYSEFAGEIFRNAGAKHVICVMKGQQIDDKACIEFSKAFYGTVFNGGLSVCQAFENAKNVVDHKSKQLGYSKSETHKFILLKSQKGEKQHSCQPLPHFPQGKPINVLGRPLFHRLPILQDTSILGRQREMQKIIQELSEYRLITIKGMPGIGKTTLAKLTAKFLLSRRYFEDGVIYLSLRGCSTVQMFMKRVVINFINQNFDKAEFEGDKDDENWTDTVQKILRYIADKDILIILDNAEDCFFEDKDRFRQSIEMFLTNVNHLSLLITSRSQIGPIKDFDERVVNLKELSKEQSCELLLKKAPREISYQEILDLINFSSGKEAQKDKSKTANIYSPFQKHATQEQQTQTAFLEHDIFKMLGGHPQAISLIAALLTEDRTLKDVYIDVMRKDLFEAGNEENGDKEAYHMKQFSLKLSLEASLKQLEKGNPEAVQFFYFIGFLPSGISDKALIEIWGKQNHLELLKRASLLQIKPIRDNQNVYLLLPYMCQYSEKHSDKEFRLKYHLKICQYYAKMMKEINKKIACHQQGESQSEEEKALYNAEKDKGSNKCEQLSTEQIMESLVRQESNIWACIFRAVDRRGRIEGDNPLLYTERSFDIAESPFSPAQSDSIQNDLSAQELSMESNQDPDSSMDESYLSSEEEKDQIVEEFYAYNELSDQDLLQNQNNPLLLKHRSNTFAEKGMVKSSNIFTQSVGPELSKSKRRETLRPGNFQTLNNSKNLSSDKFKSSEIQRIPSTMLADSFRISGFEKYNKNKVLNMVKKDLPIDDWQIFLEVDDYDKCYPSQEDKDEDFMEFVYQQTRRRQMSISSSSSPNLRLKKRGSAMSSRSSKFLDSKETVSLKHTLSQMEQIRENDDNPFKENNDSDVSSTIIISKKGSKHRKLTSVYDELHGVSDEGLLILYYVSNLLMLHQQCDAKKVVDHYGSKLEDDDLFSANLLKLRGLFNFQRQKFSKALKFYRESKDLFNQQNCILGAAICYFAIAEIYHFKKEALLTKNFDEATIAMEGRTSFLRALQMFEQINFYTGAAMCHRRLSIIEKGDKSKYHFEIYKSLSRFSQKNSRLDNRYHFVPKTLSEEFPLQLIIIESNSRELVFTKRISEFYKEEEKKVKGRAGTAIVKKNPFPKVEVKGRKFLRAKKLSKQLEIPPAQLLTPVGTMNKLVRQSTRLSNNSNHSNKAMPKSTRNQNYGTANVIPISQTISLENFEESFSYQSSNTVQLHRTKPPGTKKVPDYMAPTKSSMNKQSQFNQTQGSTFMRQSTMRFNSNSGSNVQSNRPSSPPEIDEFSSSSDDDEVFDDFNQTIWPSQISKRTHLNPQLDQKEQKEAKSQDVISYNKNTNSPSPPKKLQQARVIKEYVSQDSMISVKLGGEKNDVTVLEDEASVPELQESKPIKTKKFSGDEGFSASILPRKKTIRKSRANKE